MFEEQTQAYFARREAQERAAARAATAREARAIHLKLAYCYAALREQLASDDPDRASQSSEDG